MTCTLLSAFLLALFLSPKTMPFAKPVEPAKVPEVTISDTDEQRIDDLVTANHILADQGVLDAFGHVSVRSVKNPNHYFLSRSRAPALVTRADIMEYDLDSKPLDQQGRPMYGERFIHGEIYRARPDVQGVVHSHARSVLPFSVTAVPLKPVMHMAGFLPQVVPVFEIRDVAGPENGMLVTDTRLGAAVAKSLGSASVVLMRGHGMAVVGPSVRHAAFRSIYAQLNAEIQLEALRLGPVTYLNSAEAAGVDAVNEGSLMTGNARQWELWKTEAEAHAIAVRK